jgi:UPF0755 protein
MRKSIPFLMAVGLLVATVFAVPAMAARRYGPPAGTLSAFQVLEYSARLLWDDGLLITPVQAGAATQAFTVQPGELADSVAGRLQQAGIIRSAPIFRDYVVYTGLDTSIQSGDYQLSPSMSIVDVARALQDATPADVTFVILPGWRLEEVAASLPTTGLSITPEAFVAAAHNPPRDFDFLSRASTVEGFLYPDTYILPRRTTLAQLLDGVLRVFSLHITADMREGFARQGLDLYQAVTLASIVQRETEHDEEAPLIASVYLNRLKAGMQLDADPTVQYALGYDAIGGTWWTNPLGVQDLKLASPYNTYVIDGLPPSPIANPGLSALRAVAFPAETGFYYFRAKCDGSGYHAFAQTFEEQLQNSCP